MSIYAKKENETSKEYSARLKKINRRRGLKIAGIGVLAISATALLTAKWDNISNYAYNTWNDWTRSSEAMTITDEQLAEYKLLEEENENLRSENAALQSELNSISMGITTPEETQEIPLNEGYTLEGNIGISGNILRAYPSRYATLVDLIEKRTGHNSNLTNCGDNCDTNGEIWAVELLDSHENNIVRVDMYDKNCSGCEVFEEYYMIEITEQAMDALKVEVGGYLNNISYVNNGTLADMLEMNGSGIEALAGLLSTARGEIPSNARTIELLRDSEELVIVPSYCWSDKDSANVTIVPKESFPGEDVKPQSYEVTKEILEQVVYAVMGGEY